MKWRPGGVTSGVILCACRQHRAALAGRWFTWKSARSGRCLASPKKQPATPCNIRWFTGELVRRLARGVTSHCGNLASRRSGEDERNYRLCRTPGKAGARRCNAHSSVRLGNMRQLSPADNKCQIGIREFASRPVLWAGVPVPIRSTPGLLRAAAPGNSAPGLVRGSREVFLACGDMFLSAIPVPAGPPGQLLDATPPPGRADTCPESQVLTLGLEDTWRRSALYPTFCAVKDRVASFLVAPHFACHGFPRKSEGSKSQHIDPIIPSGSLKCE